MTTIFRLPLLKTEPHFKADDSIPWNSSYRESALFSKPFPPAFRPAVTAVISRYARGGAGSYSNMPCSQDDGSRNRSSSAFTAMPYINRKYNKSELPNGVFPVAGDTSSSEFICSIKRKESQSSFNPTIPGVKPGVTGFTPSAFIQLKAEHGSGISAAYDHTMIENRSLFSPPSGYGFKEKLNRTTEAFRPMESALYGLNHGRGGTSSPWAGTASPFIERVDSSIIHGKIGISDNYFTGITSPGIFSAGFKRDSMQDGIKSGNFRGGLFRRSSEPDRFKNSNDIFSPGLKGSSSWNYTLYRKANGTDDEKKWGICGMTAGSVKTTAAGKSVWKKKGDGDEDCSMPRPSGSEERDQRASDDTDKITGIVMKRIEDMIPHIQAGLGLEVI